MKLINTDDLINIGSSNGWSIAKNADAWVDLGQTNGKIIFDLKPTPKDRDDKLDALQYSLYVGRCNGKTMFDTKLMNEIVKEENEKMVEPISEPYSTCWTTITRKQYDDLRKELEDTKLELKRTKNREYGLRSQLKKFNRYSDCRVKSIEQSADHRTVVVIWEDKTKTIVKRSDNDQDDIYMAFTAALGKRTYGSNSKLKKIISEHLNEHKKKEDK